MWWPGSGWPGLVGSAGAVVLARWRRTVIDGVTAVAMLDQSTDSGEVSQVGFDYLALDTAGNVWILGGYTEDYEGGVYTNVDAAFLGRATGGEPGILMPATVTMATPRWYIGTSGPEETLSEGEPVAVGLTVKSMMIFDRNIIMLWMFGGRVIDEENR